MKGVRRLLWVSVLVLLSLFFWFAAWGLVLSDAEKKERVEFTRCYGGTLVSLVFTHVTSPNWVNIEVGPPIFRMRVFAVTIPGVLFSVSSLPVCPDASQSEVDAYTREFWANQMREQARSSGVIDALIQGYEAAEDARRRRGGRVLDDGVLDDGVLDDRPVGDPPMRIEPSEPAEDDSLDRESRIR